MYYIIFCVCRAYKYKTRKVESFEHQQRSLFGKKVNRFLFLVYKYRQEIIRVKSTFRMSEGDDK